MQKLVEKIVLIRHKRQVKEIYLFGVFLDDWKKMYADVTISCL